MSTKFSVIETFIWAGIFNVIFNDLIVMMMTGQSMFRMFRNDKGVLIEMFVVWGMFGVVCRTCFDLGAVLLSSLK